MRICIFAGSWLPRIGGMEIMLDRLAREFQVLGHEVSAVAKTPRGDLAGPEFPYPLVRYPRNRSSLLVGKLLRALAGEHRKRRFDVVHAHMIYPVGYAAVRAGRKLGVPVALTTHGDVMPGRRYRRRRITRCRLVWALENADAVTAVSEAMKRVIDELTAGRANSFMIPNGIDMPGPSRPPTPSRFASLEGRPFMLTLGRLNRHKGLDVLLEAVSILAREKRNLPYLVVAGEGREAQPLKRQAAELGLNELVCFAGTVVGDEKAWLLRNCLLFLQPSRSEGTPLSVLEAMANGKPVIAGEVGGNVQLVSSAWGGDGGEAGEPAESRPGPNGILVPADDPKALARAIDELVESPQREKMAANSRAVAAGFAWRPIAEQYLRLYARLLEHS